MELPCSGQRLSPGIDALFVAKTGVNVADADESGGLTGVIAGRPIQLESAVAVVKRLLRVSYAVVAGCDFGEDGGLSGAVAEGLANGECLIGVVESLLALILAFAEEREAVEGIGFACRDTLGGGDVEGPLIVLGSVPWLVLGAGGVAESVECGNALLSVLGKARSVRCAGVGVSRVLGIADAEPQVAELIQDFCGGVRVARGDRGLQGCLELGDAGLILSR